MSNYPVSAYLVKENSFCTSSIKMLHEILMTLGGFPGSLCSDDGKHILMSHLHPGEAALLARILKVASSYKNLQLFIDEHICQTSFSYESTKSIRPLQGLYLQAFCQSIYNALEPYRRDIAEMEHDILNGNLFTLANVVYRIEKFTELFYTLTSMVNFIKESGIHGCQILDLVNSQFALRVQGSKDIIVHLFRGCNAIFYKQLSSWLLHGYILDGYNEFFIQAPTGKCENLPLPPTGPKEKESSLQATVPYTNYSDFGVNFSMLPSFIPISVAQKILYIGQTVSMYSTDPNCQEIAKVISSSIWGKNEAIYFRKLVDLYEKPFFHLSSFEETINEIHSFVSKYLWELIVKKANLISEIQLIKDFYLIERGEFFSEFIKLLRSIFTGHSTGQGIDHVFGIALSKIFSNDDIRDKFQFVLSEESHDADILPAIFGQEEWAHLSIQYKVAWPLHLLFTPTIMQHYNYLFQFLFRVKKLQIDLHNTWMEQMLSRKQDPDAISDPILWELRTLFTFLIDNLQHYFQTDVLAREYTKLEVSIHNTHDLSELQRLHTQFLSNILHQTFLCMEGTASSHSNNDDGDSEDISIDTTDTSTMFHTNPIYQTMAQILEICEKFCRYPITWSGPLDDTEYTDMLEFANEFGVHTNVLMHLLLDLHSQPAENHLAQFLLRLDFNEWFSNAAIRCQKEILEHGQNA